LALKEDIDVDAARAVPFGGADSTQLGLNRQSLGDELVTI